jgi:hypothetical protein
MFCIWNAVFFWLKMGWKRNTVYHEGGSIKCMSCHMRLAYICIKKSGLFTVRWRQLQPVIGGKIAWYCLLVNHNRLWYANSIWANYWPRKKLHSSDDRWSAISLMLGYTPFFSYSLKTNF